MRRHDRVRDWLALWVAAMLSREVLTEQYVPRWDRHRNGQLERARLDVVYDNVHGRPVYVDVAITDAYTQDAHKMRQRAAEDGKAAAHKEDRKRVRYPGPDLVPFVVESLGRLGDGTQSLLRALAPSDPERRSRVLGAARQTLSVLVQMGNAELVLSAASRG